jgi:hypothetical protein
VGGNFREDGASRNPLRQVDADTQSPRVPQRLLCASAMSIRKGSFAAAIEASAPISAPKMRPFPSFGSGPGEARCDNAGVYTVTRDRVPSKTAASAKVRHSANISRFEHSGFAADWACPLVNEDSALSPSGDRTETGNAATLKQLFGGFAPQIRRFARSGLWDSSTSRCGQTLKWRPRTWEAERKRCLHPVRSDRRSENLKADFHNTPWGNSVEGELNQYGSTIFGQCLRSSGKPHERTCPDWRQSEQSCR